MMRQTDELMAEVDARRRVAGVPRRILYVEDNEGDFELMSEAFNAIGCDASLEWIPDGLVAVALIDRYPVETPLPSLLMIDINLTKLDGVAVLTRAKADLRFRDVPAIMLTSSTSPVDRDRCGAADGYFAKGSRWNDCVVLARQLCAGLESTQSS